MRSRSQATRTRKKVQEDAAKAAAAVDDGQDGEEAADHDGVTLTVNWGSEKFCPIKTSYSTFEVGAFELTAKIPPGTDIKAAARKMSALMEEVAAEQFELKLAAFLVRLRKAQREGAR